MQTLSILIPVYNEQAYLERLVDRVVAAWIPEGLQKEIVIVNDASTDRTSQVIHSLCKRYPMIRAFDQPKNAGKGAAIRRAIEEMTGDYAIIQDADLEYDPADYPTVLKPLLEEGADVVYGSRFATREMRKVLFYHHKLGNYFLTFLSNLTTGLDLTDMETCYKAFRGQVLKSIPLRSDRFGIEPEITAKIAKRGLTVYEVPISYHGRKYNEGKKIGWKDGISAIWTILKYWLIDDCYKEECGRSVLESMDHARKYTRWMVDQASKWYGPKILEIGSGTGNVSKCLPQLEKLVLTDRSSEMLDVLHKNYDGNSTVDVRKLDLDSEDDVRAIAADDRFDTVVLFNVLEHIKDDVGALKRIIPLFEPGGNLAIVVPQHEWLYGSMDEVVGHARRYSKKTIRKSLREAGYDVLHCHSFNVLSVPGWYLNFVLLKRKKMGKFQLKIYNTLVPLCALFERCFPFFPGANLLVIARPVADVP